MSGIDKNSELKCPYCGQFASQSCCVNYNALIAPGGKYPQMVQRVSYFFCPNPQCRESSIVYTLGSPKNVRPNYGDRFYSLILQSDVDFFEMKTIEYEQAVKPVSRIVQSPEHIPPTMLADYLEACRIEALSPKAAATLARRLVQAIIRDFYGVSGRTLKQEIDLIKSRIGEDVWSAIDGLRKVGNIGAHPSDDADRIVDVEPGEATALLTMVGILFRETYGERARRDKELEEVQKIAKSKES